MLSKEISIHLRNLQFSKTIISVESKQEETSNAEENNRDPDATETKPSTNDQEQTTTENDEEDEAIKSKLDYVNIECRWFPLTEAPKINDGFRQLIESNAFTEVMENIKKLSG